jgi:hypothetical protein
MNKLFVCIAALALAFQVSAGAISEKLRVLTIDLESALIGTPGVPGGEIAQELRTLLEKADPDVICLQGATDWESCDRICKLKPGLRVLTCSAFPAKAGNTIPPQVAILARDRAIISWVEEIPNGGAFAFAELQVGGRRLGIFSLQSANSPSGPSNDATMRVLAEISKLQKFPQNRPDAFLIAGSRLARSSAVIDAGLQSIATDPAAPVVSKSEFWVGHAGFIARPRSVAIKGLSGPALASDFDAGSSFSSKFAYQTPLLFAGETPAELQAAITPPPPVARDTRSLAWPVSIGLTVLILGSLMIFRGGRRAPQMALVPLNGPDGLVQAGTIPPDPVRLNLLAWLKTMFVQRLLSQRQQLLSNEEDATRRTLVIEEKLSSLQTTLQERISAYEARIERLEQELTAATVENRDLIRSQIDLLKEKVAKAKGEQVFRRN